MIDLKKSCPMIVLLCNGFTTVILTITGVLASIFLAVGILFCISFLCIQ